MIIGVGLVMVLVFLLFVLLIMLLFLCFFLLLFHLLFVLLVLLLFLLLCIQLFLLSSLLFLLFLLLAAVLHFPPTHIFHRPVSQAGLSYLCIGQVFPQNKSRLKMPVGKHCAVLVKSGALKTSIKHRQAWLTWGELDQFRGISRGGSAPGG